MLCVKRETEKYYISLVQNSSIDSEKKEYLCDLIEWYTLSGEYPPKLVQELNLLKNSPKELENKGCEGWYFDISRKINNHNPQRRMMYG